MRENPSVNGAEQDSNEPQELSFMKPIEARPADEDKPKLSRAERRAAKPQAKSYGKVQNNMRSQSVPNHRNFANRKSG